MKKAVWFAVVLTAMSYCVYAQEATTLDEALQSANRYLEERLQAGSKVVILNFQTEYVDLSNYIIDELTTLVVNGGRITAVDRQNLDMIRQEMNLQSSGEVSDESAQAIGRMLGAQTIISGSVQRLGDGYRLRVRAISVETATIQGMQNYNIRTDDSLMAALVGARPTGRTASTQTSAPASTSAPKPQGTPAGEEWKNKRWYLGVLSGYGTDFTFMTTADVFFTKNFGLGMELGWQGFTWEEGYWEEEYVGGYYGGSWNYYHYYRYPTGPLLTADLLMKLLFRSGKVELGIYAGAAINEQFFGFISGSELGFNLGPGILFLDFRASIFDLLGYGASSYSIDLGYKIGLGNR
jgi:TolB-like protein